jgi:hypothetical protein
MERTATDNEWKNVINVAILKLVVKRCALKIGYSIWNQWLSLIVFGALMVLILYLISPYEALFDVRSAIRSPAAKTYLVMHGNNAVRLTA